MATIKAFSDLQQSKKLAEILPLESADMYYTPSLIKGHTGYFPHLKRKFPIDWDIEQAIPCWSLTALLGVLPTLDDRNAILCKDIRYDKWHVCYHSTATLSIIDTERYDNAVDACVDMIEKLHELNLL